MKSSASIIADLKVLILMSGRYRRGVLQVVTYAQLCNFQSLYKDAKGKM
jgi:hypothetical protein